MGISGTHCPKWQRWEHCFKNASSFRAASSLQKELQKSRAFHNVTITYLQYLCPEEKKADPSTTMCTVALAVADTDGLVGPALLKAPSVDLFGVKRKVLAYTPRPPFVQCSRCAKAGHTNSGNPGCTRTPRCLQCGANHLTKNHRSLCERCKTEGTTSPQCPHPPSCANCGEAHRADSPDCIQRRKYSAPKVKRRRDRKGKPSGPTAQELSEGDITDLEDSSLRFAPIAGFAPQAPTPQTPGAGPSKAIAFADPPRTPSPPQQGQDDHTMTSPGSEI